MSTMLIQQIMITALLKQKTCGLTKTFLICHFGERGTGLIVTNNSLHLQMFTGCQAISYAFTYINYSSSQTRVMISVYI